MNDRELLKMAAKACGLRITPPFLCKNFIVHYDSGHTSVWNPLEDDGDALRLAVKLNLGIMSKGPTDRQEPNTVIILFETDCPRRLSQPHGGDQFAAVRRAIVCAAAEIGKSM